jgi:hypothetical protein
MLKVVLDRSSPHRRDHLFSLIKFKNTCALYREWTRTLCLRRILVTIVRVARNATHDSTRLERPQPTMSYLLPNVESYIISWFIPRGSNYRCRHRCQRWFWARNSWSWGGKTTREVREVEWWMHPLIKLSQTCWETTRVIRDFCRFVVRAANRTSQVWCSHYHDNCTAQRRRKNRQEASDSRCVGLTKETKS